MSCNYGFKFTITATEDAAAGSYAGQYLSATASNPVGITDAGIFVYSREPKMPEDGTWESMFEAVATPNDLNELQFGEPADSDTTTTKFRLDTVQVYCRSRTELESTLTYIQQDVQALLKALAFKCTHLADPVVTEYNTTDPTNTSDVNAGYSVGNTWLNVLSGVTWTCTDNTANAAVWS